MNEFSDLVLGEMPLHEWAYSLMLMSMGALLYILLKVNNRKDKEIKANIRVWAKDDKFRNVKAVAVAIILFYVLIRFYSNYQGGIIEHLPSGWKLTPFFAMFLIGLGLHWIVEWLVKKVNG